MSCAPAHNAGCLMPDARARGRACRKSTSTWNSAAGLLSVSAGAPPSTSVKAGSAVARPRPRTAAAPGGCAARRAAPQRAARRAPLDAMPISWQGSPLMM